MKVAILSMQKVYNYGSVLQAYSLKNMIEEIIGEDIKFIDIDKEYIVSADMPKNKEETSSAGILTYKSSPIYMINKIVNKLKMGNFRKKIIAFQNCVLNCNDKDNTENYDIVIVGSDEVFKCEKRVFLQLYGDIKNTDKAFTYASSCGSAVIEGILKENLEVVKKAMSNYCAMSVRDKGTYNYVSQLYSGDIQYHLDPVLMGELYKMKHKRPMKKSYMVVYAYGDRIKMVNEISAIKAYAKKHNLITVAVGAPQFWCDRFVDVEPFTALDYFYYADCVVTDTFHGSIFSVINHARFATFIRNSNKNKLEDLLGRLGLTDRIVNNADNLDKILDKGIDYIPIDEYLEKERIRARKYLRDNLA